MKVRHAVVIAMLAAALVLSASAFASTATVTPKAPATAATTTPAPYTVTTATAGIDPRLVLQPDGRLVIISAAARTGGSDVAAWRFWP